MKRDNIFMNGNRNYCKLPHLSLTTNGEHLIKDTIRNIKKKMQTPEYYKDKHLDSLKTMYFTKNTQNIELT